jgi:hypothetical protein
LRHLVVNFMCWHADIEMMYGRSRRTFRNLHPLKVIRTEERMRSVSSSFQMQVSDSDSDSD